MPGNCPCRPAHPPERGRRRWRLLVGACLLILAGCAVPPPPAATEDRVILEEFRHEMVIDADKAGDFLERTRQGTNLSEMTLGWYVYDLLSELSSQDDVLYHHFYDDDRDLQDYLKTVFRDQHASEIAVIEESAKTGHPLRRLSARYALEVLCHIPNPGEPAEVQARDRRELAATLVTLQDLLRRTAGEIVPTAR